MRATDCRNRFRSKISLCHETSPAAFTRKRCFVACDLPCDNAVVQDCEALIPTVSTLNSTRWNLATKTQTDVICRYSRNMHRQSCESKNSHDSINDVFDHANFIQDSSGCTNYRFDDNSDGIQL